MVPLSKRAAILSVDIGYGNDGGRMLVSRQPFFLKYIFAEIDWLNRFVAFNVEMQFIHPLHARMDPPTAETCFLQGRSWDDLRFKAEMCLVPATHIVAPLSGNMLTVELPFWFLIESWAGISTISSVGVEYNFLFSS